MMRKTTFVLAAVLFLAGCSNLKTYSNDLTKNLIVNAKIESGVKARVDIYEVDKKCQGEYIGSIDLDKGRNKIGLNNSKINYLDFRFISSSFFSSTTSSSGMSTLLKTRKGYIYDVLASYDDAIYDVEIWEKRINRKKGKALKIIPLQDCRQIK